MMQFSDKTQAFSAIKTKDQRIAESLKLVYQALKEKGYRPVDQIVGYILTGDPSYITSHNDARLIMRSMERNDVLEGIVAHYLAHLDKESERGE